jgi:hypothetical protein
MIIEEIKHVTSRTIIRSLIEQVWMELLPIFHGLHRGFAFQGRLYAASAASMSPARLAGLSSGA